MQKVTRGRTGRIYLDYRQCKRFLKKNGVDSIEAYRVFYLTTELLKGVRVPKEPEKTYSKEWRGWGEFLGLKKVMEIPEPEEKEGITLEDLEAQEKREFNCLRRYARKLRIKYKNHWNWVLKNDSRINSLGKHPSQIYSSIWAGMTDFLGEQYTGEYRYRTYQEAKEIGIALGVKGQKEWFSRHDKGIIPYDYPRHPEVLYKEEWNGWCDFLDKDREGMKIESIKPQRSGFLKYDAAKKVVQKLKIVGMRDWHRRKHLVTRRVPRIPDDTYIRTGEWVSYTDFFGEQYGARHRELVKNNLEALEEEKLRPKVVTYVEARNILRELGVKDSREYRELCIKGKRPKGVPYNLERVYRNDWKGWGEFLC